MQEFLDVPPPQKNFNDSSAGEPISKDTAATRPAPTFTEHFTEYWKASLVSGTVTIQPKKSMINDILGL